MIIDSTISKASIMKHSTIMKSKTFSFGVSFIVCACR